MNIYLIHLILISQYETHLIFNRFCQNYNKQRMQSWSSNQTNMARETDKSQSIDCEDIYCQHRYPNEYEVMLLDSAFLMHLIILHISDILEGDEKLNVFKEMKIDPSKPKFMELQLLKVIDDESRNKRRKNKNKIKNLRQYKDVRKKDDSNQKKPDKLSCLKYKPAHEFFNKYTTSVEIMRDNKIKRIHFRIPFFCKFIVKDIRKDIIWNSNRESNQERLENFMNKIEIYEKELKKIQYFSSKVNFKMITNELVTLNFFLFLIVVINNIVIIATAEHNYTTEGAISERYQPINHNLEIVPITYIYDIFGFWTLESIILFFNVVHIILAFIICCISMLKRYPIWYYSNWSGTSQISSQQQKSHYKFDEGSLIFVMMNWMIDKMTNTFTRKWNKLHFSIRVIGLFLDKKILPLTVYFVISLFTFYNYFIFPILLLFLVIQSKQLDIVGKSITNNFQLLLNTIMLGITLMYLYSVFGFIYFPQNFTHVSTFIF